MVYNTNSHKMQFFPPSMTYSFKWKDFLYIWKIVCLPPWMSSLSRLDAETFTMWLFLLHWALWEKIELRTTLWFSASSAMSARVVQETASISWNVYWHGIHVVSAHCCAPVDLQCTQWNSTLSPISMNIYHIENNPKINCRYQLT